MGTVQGFLPHMGPVVVGPVTGKTLVIRRRLGLFRKLFGFQKEEEVVNKAVRLIAVTGEVPVSYTHLDVYKRQVVDGGNS